MRAYLHPSSISYRRDTKTEHRCRLKDAETEAGGTFSDEHTSAGIKVERRQGGGKKEEMWRLVSRGEDEMIDGILKGQVGD